MDNYIKLISYLRTIYNISKALHWLNTKDYSLHLLYDRIADDCHDLVDSIAETCIIPFEKIMILPDEYYEQPINHASLVLVIDNAIKLVEEISKGKLLSGSKATLDEVSNKLLVKRYLLG